MREREGARARLGGLNVVTPMSSWTEYLTKLLNVEVEDLPGLPLSTLGAMATLGSYYYLQPLGDTLALSMGIEYTPLVTVGNMCLIVALNPVYAATVRQLPMEAVLPFMFRIVSVILLLFALAFYMFPGTKWLSFCFSVYVGTISLFTTTTFYGRLASLHTKSAAKRVYGIVAAGAQSGQLVASVTAPVIYAKLGNLIVLCSALVYESAVQLMTCRSRVQPPPPIEETTAKPKPDAAGSEGVPEAEAAEAAAQGKFGKCVRQLWSSAFGGFAILASTPFLRAITCHTLLITFLVSGIWYERAAAVSAAFATSEERYDFFARLNSIVGVCTLVIQTLCFSHILKVCSADEPPPARCSPTAAHPFSPRARAATRLSWDAARRAVHHRRRPVHRHRPPGPPLHRSTRWPAQGAPPPRPSPLFPSPLFPSLPLSSPLFPSPPLSSRPFPSPRAPPRAPLPPLHVVVDPSLAALAHGPGALVGSQPRCPPPLATPRPQVIHYSLAKPTKEGLYAAFPKDVVFIAKPLLDTLVYRMGSLVGAGYFTAAMNYGACARASSTSRHAARSPHTLLVRARGAGLTPKARQIMLLTVTAVWGVNSWWVGVLAERHQRAQEEENARAADQRSLL